jgi:hypothetical protein
MFSHSYFLQIPIGAVLFPKQTRAYSKREQAQKEQSIYEEFSHRPKKCSIFVFDADSFGGADRLQSRDSQIWNRRPI